MQRCDAQRICVRPQIGPPALHHAAREHGDVYLRRGWAGVREAVRVDSIQRKVPPTAQHQSCKCFMACCMWQGVPGRPAAAAERRLAEAGHLCGGEPAHGAGAGARAGCRGLIWLGHHPPVLARLLPGLQWQTQAWIASARRHSGHLAQDAEKCRLRHGHCLKLGAS